VTKAAVHGLLMRHRSGMTKKSAFMLTTADHWVELEADPQASTSPPGAAPTPPGETRMSMPSDADWPYAHHAYRDLVLTYGASSHRNGGRSSAGTRYLPKRQHMAESQAVK
jgi:hypothetical protein